MSADLSTITVQQLFTTGATALAALQVEIPALQAAYPTSGQTPDQLEQAIQAVNSQIDALNEENAKLVGFVNNSGYFTVSGSVVVGDVVSLVLNTNPLAIKWTYTVQAGDTLFSIAQKLAAAINAASLGITAQALGAEIQFTNLSSNTYSVTSGASALLTVVSGMTSANTVQDVFDYANALIAIFEGYQTALIALGADPTVLDPAIAFLQSGMGQVSAFIATQEAFAQGAGN